MLQRFAQSVQPIYGPSTESEVKFFLSDLDCGTQVRSIRGRAVGPYCTWAKTLTADYPLKYPFCAGLITEPCYWTPRLPFLYSLELMVDWAGGGSESLTAPFGFRRWGANGSDFRLEGKRTVLRGALVNSDAPNAISLARGSEMAMLVTRPDDAFCEEAGRIGGALVVDLRGQMSNWTAALRRFAWFPAVMLVLVDNDAPSPLDGVGSSLVAANVIDAESGPDRLARQRWVTVLAVELEPDQRPPAWVAVCGKPVIAIRRGVSYADFQEARAACDRLQADLAPAFNLAGYFVAP